VISGFGDATTADIYHGNDSKAARRLGRELWDRAAKAGFAECLRIYR
jgi:hypothetical protein